MSIDRRYRLIKSAIETSALGTGTTDSSTFLRGDGTWSNTILDQLGVGVAPFSSRGLTVKAPNASEVAATFNSNAGVHSIVVRPNNGGNNTISSDFESGSTYLPLSLSGRAISADFVLGTVGGVTIGVPASGQTLVATLLQQTFGSNIIGALFASTSKALRLTATANEAILEATDQTGAASYQPLRLGGSTVALMLSQVDVVTLNGSGDMTIKAANGTLIKTTTALTNNAAAAAGTLLNAPAAGNPTKWIKIDDNGTIRSIPAW